MVDRRTVNRPLEVWQDTKHPGFLFQVLAHLEPDDLGPRALVAASTPYELDLEGEIAYMDTVRDACTLMWREEDGPLPEQYLFEVPEDEEGEEDG